MSGDGDHGDEFGVDEVGMVVVAEVDLDDVDAAGEFAGAGVVGADGHAVVGADVGGFVGGEDQGVG